MTDARTTVADRREVMIHLENAKRELTLAMKAAIVTNQDVDLVYDIVSVLQDLDGMVRTQEFAGT